MIDKDLQKEQKKKLDDKIGLRVKAIREAAHQTQEGFAEMLNVSSQYISDVERGVSSLSVLAARDIHDSYCVSLDYLIAGRETENDISDVVDKLKFLDEEQLCIIERNINNHLEALALIKRRLRSCEKSEK